MHPKPLVHRLNHIACASALAWSTMPAWAQQLPVIPAPGPASGAASSQAPAAPPPAAESPKSEPSAAVDASADPSTSRIVIKGVRLRETTGKVRLDQETLARMPGTGGDPLRAVQALPGVTNRDDSSAEPAVRGARPGDNLYIVDFLPVGYLFHVGGGVSVFNADLIRRFDLYSAGWSPEYGDAVGAIFDASLRQPRQDRIGAKIDLSFTGASVLVEGPLAWDNKDGAKDGDSKASFFLAARRSYFDLVAKQVTDAEEGITVTTPVFGDYQGRLLWNLNERHRLRLDFSGANDKVAFNVGATAREGQREPVLVGSSNDKRSYASGAVVWDADLGERGALVAAVGRMDNKAATKLGSAGTIVSDVSTTYFKQQWQALRLSPAHELSFGLGVQRQEVDVNIDFLDPRCTEFDPNCDLTSAARVRTRQINRFTLADAHVLDRWTLAKHWTLTPGVRFSRDGWLKKSYAEPRLQLSHDWSERTTVSAAVGEHSQAPEVSQTLRELGNPGLGRLRSTHATLGVAQRLDQGWSWRGDVYAKRFKDLVTSDPTRNYRNAGSGTAEGLELLVKRDAVGTGFSGFTALTLSRAQRRNETTGQRFPFEYDQPVVVTTALAFKQNERWSYGLRFSYRSGAPETPIVGTRLSSDGRTLPVYGAINSTRLAPYYRLDARVDWQYSPTLKAYFEVINVTNRKNVAGFDYSLDYSTRKPIYQLPALPTFGVQWTY
jgi:hypothetical protein